MAAETASGLAATHAPAAAGIRAQAGAVARRSVTRTLRQRRLLILPVAFPLILFAINASSLASASRLRGFPPVSYRAFALAVPFLLGSMLIAVTAGTDLAQDIQSGFLNRLALTPLRPGALLAGQLGGAVAVAAVQAVLYLAVGLAAGVGIAAGALGAVVLLALSILIAIAFAGLGTLLALRFGTGEAVQGIFPLLFTLVFLSSAFLPRNLIQVRWFHDVATCNPLSYLVEGLRSLIITGWDAPALALGFGIAAAIAAASLAAASAVMKNRLVRA
jgi:ABC-2 type transport system permease protein